MKTTLEIADPLFAAARAEARRRGTSFRALVEEGLVRVLAEGPTPPAGRFRLRAAAVGGTGMDPEFAAAGWTAVRDAAYER